MMQALHDAGAPEPLGYHASEFRISSPGGDLFLGNAYEEYLAVSGAEREAVLEHYAALLLQAAASSAMTWEEAEPNLMVRVRERAYLEALLLQMLMGEEQETPLPTACPLTEHLFYGLVLDFPRSVRTVGRAELDEWGVSFEDALGIALDNLRRRTPEGLAAIQPGLYRSTWQDDYDSSRLMLPDVVREVSVAGNHVALVPNQNTLLITGSEDADGLARMAGIAESILAEPRPVCGFAVRWDGEQWVPFMPAESSPAYLPLRKTGMLSLTHYYQGQKELLDALHERLNQDIFVASFRAAHAPDGAVQSVAIWMNGGTDALLPRVDRVVFVRLDDAGDPTVLGSAPWERVHRVVGDLMEKTDDYPARFRVRTFPTEAQLQEISLE